MMLGAIFECVKLRIPIFRPELAQGTRIFSHFSGLTTTVVLARLSHDISTREGRTPRRAPSHHNRYTGASSHRAAPTQTRSGDSYFVHLATVRTRPLRPSTGRRCHPTAITTMVHLIQPPLEHTDPHTIKSIKAGIFTGTSTNPVRRLARLFSQQAQNH